MKAISLWQSWATLVAIGAKSIETRAYATKVRGTIAIHAAKHWTKELAALTATEPFASVLDAAGYWNPAQLPKGKIVAVCELYDCRKICDGYLNGGNVTSYVTANERAFGNYATGRYAWMLRNVRALPEPIPFRGAQGFFEVPDELLAAAVPAKVG